MRGKILLTITALVLATSIPVRAAKAASCPDLRVVFARGSGSGYDDDKNYNEFRATIEPKLATTTLKYEFINLEYPAVEVGLGNLGVTARAFFGGGEVAEFGESVKSGVKKLDNLVNSFSCPDTKYVLGGYSQGAMVVSKALPDLDASKVIYAATFGDPKIYLPEGAGVLPAACKGENLSDYRAYVPDCQAYVGLLGAYVPYRPEDFAGKVGTWCNKSDIFCSSHFKFTDHLAYVEDGLYEDASRMIFAKITEHFGIENNISSPHDTAILIDTTGSMSGMIERYQAEAMRLAELTLNAGGRVALYSYRDIEDQKLPIEHCNFTTCDLETFRAKLYNLQTANGGDAKESLLSGAFHTMRSLNWKRGATKSLVILTDNGFHSPDLDGITVMDVINLSRSIDPVAIYVIGDPVFENHYDELTSETGGRFVSIGEDLSLSTDEIMERFDSLPAVEDSDETFVRPEVTIGDYKISRDEIYVKFTTDAEKVLVVLNDYILGFTDGNEITISGVDPSQENTVLLIPFNETSRGESKEVSFSAEGYGGVGSPEISDAGLAMALVPKAPDTGRQ